MIKLFRLFEEIEQAREYFLQALKPCVFQASDGTVLPYRLYVPEGMSEEGGLPLQVHLHGSGLRGSDNALQLYEDSKQNQMLFAHQYLEPFVFAIPQCPAEDNWSQHGACNRLREPTDRIPMAQIEEGAITRAVYELTMHLAETYHSNRERLYISGASMGGGGVYELLYRYPTTFAAALIGCARSDVTTAPVIARTPVYMLHGTADPIISVENSRAMSKALEQYGAEFIYRELEGKIHDFTAQPDGDALLAEGMRWIYSKTRT